MRCHRLPSQEGNVIPWLLANPANAAMCGLALALVAAVGSCRVQQAGKAKAQAGEAKAQAEIINLKVALGSSKADLAKIEEVLNQQDRLIGMWKDEAWKFEQQVQASRAKAKLVEAEFRAEIADLKNNPPPPEHTGAIKWLAEHGQRLSISPSR